MADNNAALDALRAMAQGSDSYSQYQQARGAQQASRTSALDSVLGGDAAKYVAQMRAKFTPDVSTAPTDPSGLQGAYNSYVSEGAGKLASQAYESQQNLALESAKLQAQKDQVSEQERMQMLAGAAQQKQDLAHQTIANDLAAQKAQLAGAPSIVEGRDNILRQMSAIDSQMPATMLAGGIPTEATGQLQAQKQALQGQLGAYDADARARLTAMAQLAGKDDRGLETEYAKYMGSGDASGFNKLAQWVADQGAPALDNTAGQKNREVDTQQNAYLRQLAPSFGINPLRAAGLFPDYKGDPIQQAKDRAATEQYVSGEVPAADRIKMGKEEQALADDEAAQVLGFEDGAQVRSLRNSTKLNNRDILNTLQSDGWSDVERIANAYYSGADVQMPDGTTITPNADAGYPQFTKDIRDWGKHRGLSADEITRLVNIADAKLGNRMRSVLGSDRTMVQ